MISCLDLHLWRSWQGYISWTMYISGQTFNFILFHTLLLQKRGYFIFGTATTMLEFLWASSLFILIALAQGKLIYNASHKSFLHSLLSSITSLYILSSRMHWSGEVLNCFHFLALLISLLVDNLLHMQFLFGLVWKCIHNGHLWMHMLVCSFGWS